MSDRARLLSSDLEFHGEVGRESYGYILEEEVMSRGTVLVMFLVLFTVGPATGNPGVITEIIDETGDGGGNVLESAAGIAVDGSGVVYVAGLMSNNAFKITPEGVIAEIIDASGDGEGNTLGRTKCIAVDGLGNVYVTGQSSDNAFKITQDGVITEIIGTSGDGAGSELTMPLGVTADASGNVYVAGGLSDNVFKITFTPGGDVDTISEIMNAAGDGAGNALDRPYGIVVDSSDKLYVAGATSNNAFKITFTTDGDVDVITEIINATGDGVHALTEASRIAVDDLGNAYVIGETSDNAFKITPDGVVTQIIDSSGDGLGNELDKPLAIAVDWAGNVYVTGFISDNAFKITADGEITEIIDSTGDGAGNTFTASEGVAVQGWGNVYVTGFLSHNAFRISLCGDGTCDPSENSCDCPVDCGTPPSSEIPDSTCSDGLDNDCDGDADCDDPECDSDPACDGVIVPTVSEWGMIVMALLLVTGIKIKFGRRRAARA